MNHELHTVDDLPAFINYHVEKNLRYWKPDDRCEARHIIGWPAYQKVVELGLEHDYGEMFSLMVSQEVLPLRLIDRTSSKHYLYVMNN